jgi:hypothetical protein
LSCSTRKERGEGKQREGNKKQKKNMRQGLKGDSVHRNELVRLHDTKGFLNTGKKKVIFAHLF